MKVCDHCQKTSYHTSVSTYRLLFRTGEDSIPPSPVPPTHGDVTPGVDLCRPCAAALWAKLHPIWRDFRHPLRELPTGRVVYPDQNELIYG